jgi:hypothetical protein
VRSIQTFLKIWQKWKFQALANTVPRRYIRGKTVPQRFDSRVMYGFVQHFEDIGLTNQPCKKNLEILLEILLEIPEKVHLNMWICPEFIF